MSYPPSSPPSPPPPVFEVNVHWPLWTVYPACVMLFWGLYLVVVPRLSQRFVLDYRGWTHGQQMVWGQTINYLIHSVLVIVPLISVMASSGSELRAAGLYPFYDEIAYIDVCLSLGYMSFTLPWSCRVFFWMRRRDLGTNKGLILHHVAVVVAELVYLLTQVAPWYGALSLVLFELSNLNAAPHLLMTQLRYTGPWHFLNGVCFLITYTGSRVIACTVIGVMYVRDVALLRTDEWGMWLALGFSLAAYWVLMGLSYMWFQRDVMAVTHMELQRYFGREYLSKCCTLRKARAPSPKTQRARQAQAQTLAALAASSTTTASQKGASQPLAAGRL